MKIYIVFPAPLFPVKGMSQVRMINQLEYLAKDHELVFSDLVTSDVSCSQFSAHFKDMKLVYQPLYFSHSNNSLVTRVVRRLKTIVLYNFLTITQEEINLMSRHIRKQVKDLIARHRPQALMIHYWHFCFIFKYIDQSILRMIDTHYVVEENIELLDKYRVNRYQRWKLSREFDHSLKKQRGYFLSADLVIVNSSRQKELIHSWNERIPVSVIVNGQNLEPYLSFKSDDSHERAICFYGSLSNQFNRLALKRFLTRILPLLKQRLADIKLYIIGANPPPEFERLYTDESVIVTGYVDDPKEYLARCKCLVLPLETGSGFRGRVVEAMALGIPVIGTRNALQSVGFEDSMHGYIEETDEGIAEKVAVILMDNTLFKRLSGECRDFARRNFSLEDTFGVLSDTVSRMKSTNRVINER